MKALKIIGGVIFGITLVGLYVFAVMHLWNWLMPDIFGITTLTYWQTLGLLLLFKMLFLGNGWRCKDKKHVEYDNRMHWKARFRQKWEAKCHDQNKENDEQ